MENKIVIDDFELKELFANKVIQYDNDNHNTELFIYRNSILKIYTDTDKRYKHNLYVLKELFKKEKYLNNIKELVLPDSLIIYNNYIVGYKMPYINGFTLSEIIENNILNDDDIKIIFIKILDLIDRLRRLTFNMFIGDLHEKNIIVDKDLNISIIDCDSYINNNKKIINNGEVIIGKYPNSYFNNKELKRINISSDYLCILSMILNYVFKGIVESMNPIGFIKKHSEFNSLDYLTKRLDSINSFYLTNEDIDNIFNLKNTITLDDDSELEKELLRIRRI